MLRARLILLLLTLLALAVLALGCGSDTDDDTAVVDVSRAAAATGDKGTAKLTMSMRMAGMGLPQTVGFTATGVTALREARMDLTMDFASLVKAVGGPSGDARLRLLIDGAQLYAKVPKLQGLQLPGGKQWVSLDLKAAAKALGLDTAALGKLVNVDPAAQLRYLKAGSNLKAVGRENVAGAQTTHYRGTIKLRDFIAKLPASERAAAERAIKRLESLPGGAAGAKQLETPAPFEIWVDADTVVRRMKQSVTLPSQQGVPGGRMDLTYELSDFGTPLKIEAPSAGETFDATDELGALLQQGVGATP